MTDSTLSPLDSYHQKIGVITAFLSSMVAEGSNLNSLIISGSPGVGKSYTVLKKLEEYEESHGVNFTIIRGHIPPMQMYEKFVANSGPRDFTVFDDADGCFNTAGALNILKAAAETEPVRRISWDSPRASVPSFFYSGKLIVLTNVQLRSSPHYVALLDRCYIYELNVNREERLHKMKEIAEKGAETFCKDSALKAIDWLMSADCTIPDEKLSIRALVKSSHLIQSLPNWEIMLPIFINNMAEG